MEKSQIPIDGIPGTKYYQYEGKTIPWPKGITELEKKYPGITWWK